MHTSTEMLSSYLSLRHSSGGAETASPHLPATPDAPGNPWLVRGGGRPADAGQAQLRSALAEARLLYRSRPMAELVDCARLAAPTDATVLVTGPSGTGKELVARTVHALSPRRGKPVAVVDCGAISASLIDSELFGHERGAYTGAASRTAGRLAEAAGSTLILDEIGELPLEVQAKLLRFVQEKQITPVGGTRPRTVDARLVALTHRDLAAEVAAGRFRADLYYRLKVVHLQVPALAERPDDIPLLADHFVGKFSARYQKDLLGLSAEASAAVARHPWPGNVRELENRILQAVILGRGREITPRQLGLGAETARPAAEAVSGRSMASSSAGKSPQRPSAETLWESLRLELRRQLDGATIRSAAGVEALPPIGHWLIQDLLIAASDAAQGRLRRAAALLGIPKSTFARRLRQAQTEATGRPPGWQAIYSLLAELVRARHPEDHDLPRHAREILIAEIASTPTAGTAATGAALMGVTAVTFRRWRKILAAGG